MTTRSLTIRGAPPLHGTPLTTARPCPPPARSAAIDLQTKELVAIKKVSHCFNNLTEAKRLLRELRILRHLDDPHVIKIRGLLRPTSLETFQDLWIVMDYVDLDMRKLIVSPQTITLQHVQWIVRQLLSALSHIHAAHVLHRDLKPANVLLNGSCDVKVCDFGLSRVVNESGVFDPPEPTDPAALLSPEPSRPAMITRQLTSHVVTRWYRAPVRAWRGAARGSRRPARASCPPRWPRGSERCVGRQGPQLSSLGELADRRPGRALRAPAPRRS